VTVILPTPAQLRVAAEACGLSLSDEDVSSYRGLMVQFVDSYNVVATLADEVPAVKYPRSPGYRPSAEEDPHNAWYRRIELKGAPNGKLKGKKVAIKDNTMVAGIPMMNGSSTLEGFVPDFDATIVTRLLDAGAEIIGKAHCESFCISGGSHTNSTGLTHNPHKMGYSAGGSSSGSGVIVSLGQADMATGGDQAGSIRMPASFCGVYGMKPTYGLVPYTGIMPIEVSVDHTGPMTSNLADNALMLEVMAGDDGYDPRMKGSPRSIEYTKSLSEGIRGLKIAILKEGFEQPTAEAAVNETVRAAAARLRSLGAIIEEVSVPMHLAGAAIWTPVGVEGVTQTMMFGDGYGMGRSDLYSTSLMAAHHGWRAQAASLSESVKTILMFGTYINGIFGSRNYGKATNIARRLQAAYDMVFNSFDLILMPTTPTKATPLPGPDARREEVVQRAMENILNTCPFNLTQHPSLSLPCGMADGLPVGLMLTGRRFEEQTIYRAAYAFEQSADWKTL
jgi:amidase